MFTLVSKINLKKCVKNSTFGKPTETSPNQI